MLSPGSPAPDFDLPTAPDEGQLSKAALLGHPWVLVFYPKDQTPGCTRQLCALRDDLKAFDALGARIVASNPGSMASHQRFIEKERYPFPILVDADRSMARDYRALKENGTSIERTVYVIDAQGVIRFAKRGMPSDETLLEVIRGL